VIRFKSLTPKVRAGLHHIQSEMDATADTMDDRPEEAAAIRAALAWISYQRSRADRRRALSPLPQQPKKGNLP
jgi:hypothetical protein